MKSPQRHLPFWGMCLPLGAVLFLCVLSACTSGGSGAKGAGAQAPGQRPAACSAPTIGEHPPPLKPTTLTTIEQTYWCLFDRYVTGKTLDDRTLLKGAFSGFLQELLRRGSRHFFPPFSPLRICRGDFR
jgi:carboxyl-terminal processing protease